MERLSMWAPRALSVLRIVTALLFIEHGTQKLFGFPDGGSSQTMEALMSQMGIAGILEVVGGSLILVGLFSRPVAFILSGMMAVAYWLVHAPHSFFPINNGGDAAVLFCFVFLYMVFAGPGPWSLDAMLKRPAAPAA